jgi:two-component system chemotaxis response regulator CheB
MAATRVLLVDDSVVVRRVLTEALTGHADLEVVGTAASGSIALQKIPQINPDLIVLDVEMPGMDGLETLQHIRAGWPRLPVIMCSSLTERGAETTLRALSFGASDYVTKPSSLVGAPADGVGGFRAELLQKIRVLTGRGTVFPAPVRIGSLSMEPPRLSRLPLPPSVTRAPVSVIGIGASTGGPNALAKVFEGLARELTVPLLLVQHMPPLFTKLLADRLASTTGLVVHEATHGEKVETGCVYVAPGDFHMSVVRSGVDVRIALNQDPAENSCRPAVDVLFRSLASVYGPGVLAAVMTGMGRDGTRGARNVVEAGGTVIVQDSASCVVASMPQSVADAGVSDGAYPLDGLASELLRRVRLRTASRDSLHLSFRRTGG